MVEYLTIPCPNCHRNLRVRMEYIGQLIACNHCRQVFLATSGDLRALGFFYRQAGGSNQGVSSEAATDHEVTAAGSRIPQVATEFPVASEQRATAGQEFPEAQDPLARLHSQVLALEHQLEEARQQYWQVASREHELEDAHSELERLRQAKSEWEQDRQAYTHDFEAQLRTERADRATERGRWQEQLQALEQDLQRARSAVQAERERALEAVAAEQSRTAGERRQWQDQLAASERQFLEDRERVEGQLDRLRQEVAAVEQERTLALRQIESLSQERDRLAVQRDEINGARQNVERMLAAIEQDLQQARSDAQAEHARALEAVAAEQSRTVAARQQWQDLAACCDALTASHRAAEQRLEAEVARVSQALAQVEQQQVSDRRHNSELDQRAKTLRIELDQQRERAAEYQRATAALEQDLAAAKADANAERERMLAAMATEQSRATIERQQWQERLETLQRQFQQDRDVLEASAERLRQDSARLRKQQDSALRQIDALTQERDRLAPSSDSIEPSRPNTEQFAWMTAARLTQALEQTQQQNELAGSLSSGLDPEPHRSTQRYEHRRGLTELAKALGRWFIGHHQQDHQTQAVIQRRIQALRTNRPETRT